ncbi:MAG TPA: M42 family metallopeptidase [Thermodesulfobacteriota bacterium]|nr:M42 family metallopeptidase [Thermodesulfobacteriota bacterium]
MQIELLKRLCEAPGLPGAEEPVKEIVISALREFTEEIVEDKLGNVIGHIPGDGPRLVLDAHMDEVGFMVSRIDERGFLNVIPLGGIDSKVFYGQRLAVWGKRPLTGMVAALPPHLSKTTGEKEAPEVEDCIIDLGLSGEKVKSLVKVGDVVSYFSPFVETEDAVMCKAIDDRVGLFVILEALRRRPELSCDLYVSATVQEEVGLRGARVIVPVYEPDVVIALEGTVSNDLPGVPGHRTLAKVGKGPEIRLSDRYLVANRALSFFITGLAEKHNIPYQVTVKKAGSTNATALQVTGKGSRATVVSVPVRYLHSPSCLAYKGDIEETIKLIFAILEEIKYLNLNA